LRPTDVPSVKTDPVEREGARPTPTWPAATRAPSGPRLQVQRQNLKGDAAAHAPSRSGPRPTRIDRATANGDIDHTEQVTDLKITLKK
jgi:hypothetical protein